MTSSAKPNRNEKVKAYISLKSLAKEAKSREMSQMKQTESCSKSLHDSFEQREGRKST